MVAIKNIVFCAAAASASIIRRQTTSAADLQSSLSTIDADINSLMQSVENYNGGLIAALPIQLEESTLESHLADAIKEFENTDSLSSADSQAIIDYIENQLEPDMEAALTALAEKFSQIDSAGLMNIVNMDLTSLRSKTTELGNAMSEIAPEEIQAEIEEVLAMLDGHFADVIPTEL